MVLPILYSFRRCPYAMRARFALKLAGITCILREVSLKNKPEALTNISPKGTVPVFVLGDGSLLEQSITIVEWALRQKNDPPLTSEQEARAQEIIDFNDNEFVKIVHRYKYRDLYPEQDFTPNKTALFNHLESLNSHLVSTSFFISNSITKADIALFPFIRQVIQIAPAEFEIPSLALLRRWLDRFLQHPLFDQVMAKHPVWSPGDTDIIF